MVRYEAQASATVSIDVEADSREEAQEKANELIAGDEFTLELVNGEEVTVAIDKVHEDVDVVPIGPEE